MNTGRTLSFLSVQRITVVFSRDGLGTVIDHISAKLSAPFRISLPAASQKLLKYDTIRMLLVVMVPWLPGWRT
jgi:hypothetical protein